MSNRPSAPRGGMFERKPPKNTPGATCHKCKIDKLCDKHHGDGIFQVLCPCCGYEATKPYRKEDEV